MVDVTIRPGVSARDVADTLRARGVIDSKLDFLFLVWLNRNGDRIRAGRYRLAADSKEGHVLRILTRDVPARLMVTIPEGYTMPQVAATLEQYDVCTAADFIAACADTALLRNLGIPIASAEGYLFPETYDIGTDDPPREIVRRLIRQCLTVLADLQSGDTTRARQKSTWDTIQNDGRFGHVPVVTLASIVEKEAQVPEEFPRIAGVFLNRLQRRLPLQSCATVEYILKDRKPRLSVEDTRIPSPYNTYLHAGLPPGPICNPGRRALAAVLNPERSDYLFFVARGDGSHIFSRTPAEHAAACRRARSGV